MEIEKEMQYSRICPVCRSVIRKKIYTSYEVTAPYEQFKTINDLKERFSAVCPKCGYSIPLGFPFRYVDRLQHFDLFLVPNGYPSENEILNSLSEFDVNSGYITRLVSDDLELFDKIRIFSAGLDDRVVELCKVTVLGDYCESNPKYAQLPLLRAQYFKHEKDNTEYSGANIQMYTLQNGEKKETIALALSLDYYLNIQRHCQIDIDAQPTGCFDVINLNWANRLCDYRKRRLGL